MTSAAWQPEPAWRPAPRGRGSAQVFWAERDGAPVVVKRLERPHRPDPAAYAGPGDAAYWRREADAALDGCLVATPGVRAAPVLAVEEDEDGVTLVVRRVEPADPTGPGLARALGRFAAADLEPRPWWAGAVLADRLARVAERGGWPTLARTTLADVTDRLWQRRRHHLAGLAAAPQRPAHGDPTPDNLPGREGDRVVGVDWAMAGSGPAGADVGYLALSCREDLDVLVDAYVAGLAAGGVDLDRSVVAHAAAVTACYTSLTRTEWALARVASGPGALAGKYRHPSVAPYIRQLQRLFPQLETLV